MQIPGFAVAEEIGRGGFGVVYRGRELAGGREVAIKVLQAPVGSDEHRRFERECEAVAALPPHPGLPRLYATGRTEDGAPFLAMQLLPGGSLAERLPLPAAAATDVAAKLADTLQVAHDSGIVHRDVKPANVLFDSGGEPVLVDFGIASLVGASTLSAADDVAVSIAFAAPEVLAGADADVSADVYAIGATLFCVLAGRPPFVPTSGTEPVAVVAERIARDPVEDLRPLGVPQALCTVIETAMAKRPGERYRSSAELAAALRAAGIRPARRVPHGRRTVTAAVAAATVVLAGIATAVALSAGSEGAGHRAAVQQGLRAAGSPAGDAGGAVPGSGSGVPGAAARPVGADGQFGASGIDMTGTDTLAAAPAAPSGAERPAGRPGAPGTGTGAPTSTAGSAPSTPPPTPAPSPSPTSSAPPRPPSISARSGTFDELAAVSIAVTTADPQHETVTVRAAHLPSWLHLSGGHLHGTIPYTAASVTTTHTHIRSVTFTVALTATDSSGAHSSRSVKLVVRDTYRTMPDYIGKTGTAAPSISAVSTVTRSCAYQKSGNDTRIYWQSVRPGTVIRWGRAVTYLYGRDRTSCRHVSGHYPS